MRQGFNSPEDLNKFKSISDLYTSYVDALEKMHKYIVDYYNELFVIVEEDKIKFNPDNKIYDAVLIRYVHHVLHDDRVHHRDNSIRLSFLFVVSF
ncbi:hypothetical protein PAPYR_7578 [Paratrimastix pyriformis]|uniref:Uncharacterized protein n=1 Tax=Paratrimastix pyriformis TaxID=342808 RepID=A0ABQ8UID5_9EUKA|nr:hypothetical protein PAPYR_7578 [Paratrimastix pyriformis]